jgi:hypothetical protein
MSLEEQYDLLDVAGCSKTAAPKLAEVRRLSTTSVFVDLDEKGCNPTFTVDSGDVSTESDCSETPSLDDMLEENACELGSRVSVHVDIDPDDDDVFFSMHRQEPAADGARDSICPRQVQTNAPTSVHVDIDPEDDDVFFSVHKHEPHGLALPAATSQQQPAAVPLPVHSCSSDSVCSSADAVCNSAASCPEEDAAQQSQDLSKESSLSAMLPQPAAHKLAGSCFEDLSPKRASAESVSLRPVAPIVSEQTSSTTTPGLLADLKGGRAQGVRNHLARKLTQEDQED